jgi:MerR family transcriptional regulator, copper efflux regulator
MVELTIGQVAKQTHVNIETVRYYERRGLIPEPPRRESGYRQFSPEVITRIKFIKRAQELGFSLDEISELLTLRVDPQMPCSEVKQRAEVKIADIEHKIADLQRMKQTLVKVTNACTGQGSTSVCPILDALEPDEDEYL